MQRVVFFANPIWAHGGGGRAAVERCAEIVRAEGCMAEVRETLRGRAAGEQAREAVESGFDTVFACGGDGTLFQILQGVAGSAAVLGVVPLGTGNVLARNLRLPRDPVAAMLTQWKIDAEEIPLGEIACSDASGRERSWYFTIAAGIGIHAAVMNTAASARSKRLWGRGVYYSGGLRLLLRHAIQPFEVELTGADGRVREFRACELLATRVPAIDHWRPGGDLRSAHLRVAAVPHTSRVGLAYAGFQAVMNRQSRGGEADRRLPYPMYDDAAQVVCRPVAEFSYKAPMLVSADGEVIGMGRAIFRMAKKRLRLLWPR